jgi:hypothetical protein
LAVAYRVDHLAGKQPHATVEDTRVGIIALRIDEVAPQAIILRRAALCVLRKFLSVSPCVRVMPGQVQCTKQSTSTASLL